MSTWPDIEVENAGPKRKSAWPEPNKMARMLRSGRTISDLSVRYGIHPNVLKQQLAVYGWDPRTGVWVGGAEHGAPLTARGDGAGLALSYVGGGDNPNVVPTKPRSYTPKPKPTGFNWPEMPPFIPPRKPVRLPPPRAQNRSAMRKLTDQMLVEIARRYTEEFDSSMELARDYNVNPRTIRKALRHMEVEIRDRSEANLVRHARRRQAIVAQGWVDGVSKEAAS